MKFEFSGSRKRVCLAKKPCCSRLMIVLYSKLMKFEFSGSRKKPVWKKGLAVPGQCLSLD
jgi:hypothetical protein